VNIKTDAERKVTISLRLHPQVMKKLRRRAKREGIGYQTLIHAILVNEIEWSDGPAVGSK